MPSPSVLDFDSLLGPIGGDEPAGQSVPFSIREQLDENRKEINPDDYDTDDPTRPTEVKYADWGAIERLARQTLEETSKDLLVAARLTEALLKRHGFAGLADGFVLFRRLIDECWDRILPSIEDGDLEVRAGPFNWLGEERGARFPPAVRSTTILTGPDGSFSWYDWKNSQGNASVRDRVEKAIMAASREECQTLLEDTERCFEELVTLDRVLEEKLGRDAPGMTDLKSAVNDCRNLARQIMQRKGPGVSVEEDGQETGGEEQGSSEGGGGGGPARAMRSRADVYARLVEAATVLEQLEPHSPIPYLIKKAVELGALPFPQLMKALIRDDAVLSEMNRELGIKESEE